MPSCMRRIEHNLFYRAEGDREAVSIKTPGTTLRWNVFRDMDAAPNIRGSRNAVVSGQSPDPHAPHPHQRLRSPGREQRYACARPRASALSSRTARRATRRRSTRVIRNNVVATKRVGILFGAQTQPLETMAHGNKIVANMFHLPKNRPIYEIRPPDTESRINQDNSLTGDRRGPDLCS